MTAIYVVDEVISKACWNTSFSRLSIVGNTEYKLVLITVGLSD